MNIFKIIKEEYKLILESSKTLQQFYLENNIDPDELRWLGKGDFGEAYSIGDGRVLKETRSESEFHIAKELENNTAPALSGFAKIYKTDIVDGTMYIIMEELDPYSKIEDLYYELTNLLDQEGLPIQYMNNLDTDEHEISDDLQSFMDDVDDIIRSYRYLGIEASDIRPENMGYDSSGKLKAFDIDDKSR